MSAALLNISYIVAAVLFIFGIKMLGSAATARRGNLISAVGMLLAIAVTLLKSGMDYQWVLIGLGIGAVVGAVWARWVKMTGMPELVALFNGFGGLASVFVAWAEFQKYYTAGGISGEANAGFIAAVIAAAVWIGTLTFSGSLVAWGKLSGKLSGKPTMLPKQRIIGVVLLLLAVLAGSVFAYHPDSLFGYGLFFCVLAAGIGLGLFAVLPIGGGDMPVVISLLNSLSGLAASAAGFAIQNNVLIVAGCLVGCSGMVLTIIMCKAMNRNLWNVLFSGFGADSGGGEIEVEGEMKAASVADAYYVLEAARTVVIVPGYGMAVAQAQHAVKELGDLLEENGAEVLYAIHPVDTALGLMGGGVVGVVNVGEEGRDILRLRWEDGRQAVLHMYDRAIAGGRRFIVYGPDGHAETADFGEIHPPLLEQLLRMCRTGEPPVSSAEMIEAATIVEAIRPLRGAVEELTL